MAGFGLLLIVVGLVGLIVGLRMMLKAKKMRTVPFHTPSEIAAKGSSLASPKGLISTEGEAEFGEEVLIAPMSGEKCLAYEIVLTREYEKTEQTDEGPKTKSGSDREHSEFKGARFVIKDAQNGSIPVNVDKLPDADFVQSHSSKVKIGMMIPGSIAFGQLQMQTPQLPRDSRTTAFVGTERIVKPGHMYALGALKDGELATPPGLTGTLTLSGKGREKLLGSTLRNMKAGYAVGGVSLVVGIVLSIVAPKPAKAELPAPSAPSAAAPSQAKPGAAAAAADDVLDNVSASCQKAVECCIALQGDDTKNDDACGALFKASENTCKSSLDNFRKAAKRAKNKVAVSACR